MFCKQQSATIKITNNCYSSSNRKKEVQQFQRQTVLLFTLVFIITRSNGFEICNTINSSFLMSLDFWRQENHRRSLSFSITTFRTREGKTGGNQNWLHRKDRLSQYHDFFIRQGIPKTRPIISNDNCTDIKRSLQRCRTVTIKWRNRMAIEVYIHGGKTNSNILRHLIVIPPRRDDSIHSSCMSLSFNQWHYNFQHGPPKSLT